jgi:hypothetical protein
MDRTPHALLAALCLGACGAPRLPPPPPPEPPQTVAVPALRVRRGSNATTEAIDTESAEGRVRAALMLRRGDIQECYERVLPASPDAAGRITFRFTVETTGLVSDAQAQTDAAPLRQTRECVLQLIRPLQVERVSRAMAIEWPFEFENPVLRVEVPEVVLFPRMSFPAEQSVATLVGAGSGDLTADEVRAVAAPLLRPMLNCYAPILRERATRRAEGRARFELTVTPDGAVADVAMLDVTETVRPAGECMSAAMRGLHFRNSGRRAVIVVPVTMRPQETPTLR